MYGTISIIFVVIVSLGYYILCTFNQQAFKISEIRLSKQIINENQTVFGTCIDKRILYSDYNKQIKLKSQSQLSYVILFNRKPFLQCQQLSYALQFNKLQQFQYQVNVENITSLKEVFGQVEVRKLTSDQFVKIKNDKVFILVISINKTNQQYTKIQQIKPHYSPNIQQQISSNNKYKHPSNKIDLITLAIQNDKYSTTTIKPIFWFSWFNLILISLISYYRKNIFNTKLKLLSSISLLVYMVWIGFNNQYHLQQLQQSIKLAMILFLLIISIKNKLDLYSTLFMIGLAAFNQIALDIQFNQQLIWLTYALNLLNLRQFAYGQNIEIIIFSLFSFIIQYGLINKLVDIMSPFIFCVIVVNLVFGPSIYQLIELVQDFNIQNAKNKQRLQSYQVSQTDQLFKK